MIKQEKINKVTKYVILAYLATRVAGFVNKGFETVSVFSLTVLFLLFFIWFICIT